MDFVHRAPDGVLGITERNALREVVRDGGGYGCTGVGYTNRRRTAGEVAESRERNHRLMTGADGRARGGVAAAAVGQGVQCQVARGVVGDGRCGRLTGRLELRRAGDGLSRLSARDGPARGADVQLLQDVRRLHEFRRDLHDHVVLLGVERVVDCGHLRLREGAAQCAVDETLVESQAVGRIAIDDQVRFQPTRLQVGIDIGDLFHVLQRDADLLGPVAQLGEIVSQERELILRVGTASATTAAEILLRLEESVDPWNSQQLRAQACDHAVGGVRSFGKGFEAHTQLRHGAVAVAAANRAHHARYRWVLLNDPDNLLQLAFHRLEGRRSITPHASAQLSRILLRKEALGYDDVQVDIQADRRQQREHHELRVIECPFEGLLVLTPRRIEETLEPVTDAPTALLFLLLRRLEDPGAHHRRSRQ